MVTSPAATLPRTSARPFLKWAGGKGQLLPQLSMLYPKKVRRYFEPFVGSAAVFFDVRQRFQFEAATLSDTNGELINCYRVVRDDVDTLIERLRQHKALHHARYPDHYYDVRALPPDSLSQVERAARLIYLNKTCYNGLYRVNGQGEFNVPVGSYPNPPICDVELLQSASRALGGVELLVGDFADLLPELSPEDFVYLDPPYYPMSKTANFTAYTEGRFDIEQQIRLAQFFRDADGQGCHVMLSNSDTPVMRELYKGFAISSVNATRRINSNGNRRGIITELVITNY